MSQFIQEHDGPHNLLIVYYTGHGRYLEDQNYLELTASLFPMDLRGFQREAKCNWNKIQELLQEDDVESVSIFGVTSGCFCCRYFSTSSETSNSLKLKQLTSTKPPSCLECSANLYLKDVLTILDTCYASNLTKGAKEETRAFELLSACAIDSTTAKPGNNSFTRALIDTMVRLHADNGERGFNTFRLNQGISLDKRRHDTPSQLWSLKQSSNPHIHLAPLKPQETRELKARRLPQLPKGYLTLRFALRDRSLNQEQIEFLTLQLSKAINNKKMVGVSRIDWLGIKPARTTSLGRAALAMYVVRKWKRICERQRKTRLNGAVVRESSRIDQPPVTPRKRSRDSFSGSPTPERTRDFLAPSEPPSPPLSTSSRS